MLVRLGPGAERPDQPGVTPLEGSPQRIAAGLRDLAEAGAHEVIVVCDPITEASVRELGSLLPSLRA